MGDTGNDFDKTMLRRIRHLTSGRRHSVGKVLVYSIPVNLKSEVPANTPSGLEVVRPGHFYENRTNWKELSPALGHWTGKELTSL
jgi:hypothetical protein